MVDSGPEQKWKLTSAFLRSSDVGLPICCQGSTRQYRTVSLTKVQNEGRTFWLLSNIIFSTIALVSPSKSDSFEFSGLILVVSIVGAPMTTAFHQVCWLSFSR